MRAYDIAIASLAIDAPPKWTDNAISLHQVDGIVSRQRGVARKVTHAALIQLAVARQLHVGLGLGVRDALHIAGQLLQPGTAGVHTIGHFTIALDVVSLEREVSARLNDALESAPAPRRGRPRQLA